MAISRRSASTAFLFRGEPGLGAFDERREIVGLDHQFENLVFEGLDLALRKPDFLLDGVVFLIGLDGHGLLAELRETALVEGDVLLDRAAGVLVFGQPLLGGGHGLARGVEPRLERLLAFGLVGEPSLGVVGRRDELLKRDDAFEVSVQ